MTRYKNLSGNSGVAAYDFDDDYDPETIIVQFTDGSVYTYTYDSASPEEIETMKVYADAGRGLNTYINQVVCYQKRGFATRENVPMGRGFKNPPGSQPRLPLAYTTEGTPEETALRPRPARSTARPLTYANASTRNYGMMEPEPLAKPLSQRFLGGIRSKIGSFLFTHGGSRNPGKKKR
jgi:hypothetical protein